MHDKILDVDLTFAGNVPSHVKSEQISSKVRGKVSNLKVTKTVDQQFDQTLPHQDLGIENQVHVLDDVPVVKPEMEAEL